MLCLVRLARLLGALLGPLEHPLRWAAALHRRHRRLLAEPVYRAQTTAGTAALLTLLRVPRPLATQPLAVLRRTPTGELTEPDLSLIDRDDTP